MDVKLPRSRPNPNACWESGRSNSTWNFPQSSPHHLDRAFLQFSPKNNSNHDFRRQTSIRPSKNSRRRYLVASHNGVDQIRQPSCHSAALRCYLARRDEPSGPERDCHGPVSRRVSQTNPFAASSCVFSPWSHRDPVQEIDTCAGLLLTTPRLLPSQLPHRHKTRRPRPTAAGSRKAQCAFGSRTGCKPTARRCYDLSRTRSALWRTRDVPCRRASGLWPRASVS